MSDWRDAAACRKEDPELFFPVGAGPVADLQADQAKAVCARCPVADTCRDWSLTRPVELAGVWGGLTERERRSVRRRTRVAW